MTIRALGNLRRRSEGRWLLAGLLMVTTALIMVPKAEAQQASLEPWQYIIRDLTGDGRMFVGSSALNAYIGDVGGAEYQLPSQGWTMMEAMAINRNGGVVVGRGMGGSSGRAWRFVGNMSGGVVTDLGTLTPAIASANSQAHDVSDAGDRVAGYATWQGLQRGFVWIEGATGGVTDNEQMYALDALAGGYNRTEAYGISGDGRYAVGWSDGAGFARQAVRWDLSGLESGGTVQVENLGSLTGMVGHSNAFGASVDGRVIVGESEDADGRTRAFRWHEGATNGVAANVQMLDLGDLGGQYASAKAVSRDGQWVVGMSQDENDYVLAFRWSEEGGMESVEAWLQRNGVTVTDYRLENASSISDDGSVVVGYMVDEYSDARGYLARVPAGNGEGPGGLMNVEEYHRTLYAGAGGVAAAGEFLTWLPMNGAHHRPLMLAPDMTGDMCAWATGDLAHHGLSSTGLALAEIGACTDLAGGAVRIGGAVGTAGSWQDLALGGSARMQGQYVLSEVDWHPDGTPLLLSLTGMVGSYKADLDRAYSNGASTAVSSGQTNALGGVVRLRADWLDAARLGNTRFNPWTAASLGALHIDGYSERGGPFPATFNAQTLTHLDVRVGLTAVSEFSTQTQLSTTVEVAHRTGTAPAASGQVDGLFNFSLGGGTQAQTWLRVGAELDHELTDHMSLSASMHLATAGRDPSIAGSLGLKGEF